MLSRRSLKSVDRLHLIRRCRTFVFLTKRIGQALLVEEKAFGHEERVLLLLGVQLRLDELLQRQFIEVFELRLPKRFLEGNLVSGFEARQRQLEIEIVEVISEQFPDRRAGIALNQIITDIVKDLDE